MSATKGMRMVYVEPPIERVPVAELRLDLTNYRFPNAAVDDHAAMNYLFDEHDVMSVARDVLISGYFDNELPLVVEEAGHYVILEGNRRVSALRALHDPTTVPAKQAELERLLKRHANEAQALPETIRVMRVADRESAAPHLARLHVGESKRAWSLDEQAAFVLAQLVDGIDVAALKDLLPGVKSVPRLVRMGRVRQLLRGLDLGDRGLNDYARGDALKMSVLEYAYKDRQIARLVGISFDADGELKTRPSTPEQLAVLRRVIAGFKSGELSTRKVLNAKKSTEYEQLIGELKQLAGITPTLPGDDAAPQAPDAESHRDRQGPDIGGSGPSGEGPGSSGRPAGAGGQLTGARGANRPDTATKLSISFDHSNTTTGIRQRLVELRKLDLAQTPVAVAMLLRSIIETSTKWHYAAKGTHFAPHQGLSDMVSKLDADYKSYGALKRPLLLLKGASNAKGKPGSIAWFNAVAHDHQVPVRAQDLRDAWQQLEGLVQFLLIPPSSSV